MIKKFRDNFNLLFGQDLRFFSIKMFRYCGDSLKRVGLTQAQAG